MSTVEHDIRSDPKAAARVRQVTGGDETVPTVLVGRRALVNPGLPHIVAAVREQFPDHADAVLGRAGEVAVPPVWRTGALAGEGVGVLWALLASSSQDTTWHAAPFLMAAAAPWLVARRVQGTNGALPLLVRVGGLLRGPVVAGQGSEALEAVVFAMLGAGVGLGLPARRTRRAPKD